MNKEEIETIKEEMCDKYCRYRRLWDEELMGGTLIDVVCEDCPMQRLKIKEYEEKQTNDEIRVGDEVILIKPNTKSIVRKISGDLYYLIGEDIAYYSDELKATGRHFDEIEEILKQKARDKE